jgi:hypothetical protein
MATSERQERKGKFPSDCDKKCFSIEVITTEQVQLFLQQDPSIHSCLSQDLTRTTHRFIVYDLCGHHGLSRERGKDAEEIKDT